MAVKLVVVALVEVPLAGAALVVVRVLLIAEGSGSHATEVGMGEPPKREVCINGKQYKLIIIE